MASASSLFTLRGAREPSQPVPLTRSASVPRFVALVALLVHLHLDRLDALLASVLGLTLRADAPHVDPGRHLGGRPTPRTSRASPGCSSASDVDLMGASETGSARSMSALPGGAAGTLCTQPMLAALLSTSVETSMKTYQSLEYLMPLQQCAPVSFTRLVYSCHASCPFPQAVQWRRRCSLRSRHPFARLTSHAPRSNHREDRATPRRHRATVSDLALAARPDRSPSQATCRPQAMGTHLRRTAIQARGAGARGPLARFIDTRPCGSRRPVPAAARRNAVSSLPAACARRLRARALRLPCAARPRGLRAPSRACSARLPRIPTSGTSAGRPAGSTAAAAAAAAAGTAAATAAAAPTGPVPHVSVPVAVRAGIRTAWALPRAAGSAGILPVSVRRLPAGRRAAHASPATGCCASRPAGSHPLTCSAAAASTAWTPPWASRCGGLT